MVRQFFIVALLLSATCVAGPACAETRAATVAVAKAPAPSTTQPPAWTLPEIVQHIDGLRQIAQPQVTAQEVVRILAAIMSQPDPAVRMMLFNRLRPSITPYTPQSAAASSQTSSPASRLVDTAQRRAHAHDATPTTLHSAPIRRRLRPHPVAAVGQFLRDQPAADELQTVLLQLRLLSI